MRRAAATTNPTAALPHAVPDAVGGYRTVRALGAGVGASVYLAHSPSASPATVAVKFPATEDAVNAAEVDALSLCASPHVVRLVDVWASGEGTALLLENLTGGSLSALLRRERPLAPGELVTIVVSVARGVLALHEAGFAHGALAPSAVLFDESGRPVLACLGRARRLGSSNDDAAEAEWERFAALTDTVLARTRAFGRDPAVAAVGEAAAQLARGGGDRRGRVELFEQAAFALAPAAPLRLDDDPVLVRSPGSDAGPGSAHAGSRIRPPRSARRPGAEPSGASSGGESGQPLAARLREALAEMMERGVRSVLHDRLGSRLRGRRGLMAAAAGGCATLVAVGLLAMPSSPTRSHTQSTAAPPVAASPLPSSSTMPGTPPSTPAGTTAIDGDDPVAAVAALLIRRDACLARGGGDCLLACDQEGSPLLAADRGSSDRTVRYRAHVPALVERTGDAALLTLTPPVTASVSTALPDASALAVKGEGGWRLRELYEG